MILLFMAFGATAQNNLAGAIRGTKGTSLHFVNLSDNQSGNSVVTI